MHTFHMFTPLDYEPHHHEHNALVFSCLPESEAFTDVPLAAMFEFYGEGCVNASEVVWAIMRSDKHNRLGLEGAINTMVAFWDLLTAEPIKRSKIENAVLRAFSQPRGPKL